MYSERLLALFHSGRHAGALAGATHRGVGGTPGAGPYLVLSFRVEAGVVREARYKTYGCPAAIACAEAACAWSEAQELASLARATPTAVTEWVGGVPEGKEHCPELAARALAGVTALA